MREENGILREYAQFVEITRDYLEQERIDGILTGDSYDRALEQSIAYCIANDILKDFLLLHRDEVKQAVMLDYSFERRLELAKEENRKEVEHLESQLRQRDEQLSEKDEQLSEKEEQLSQRDEQLSQKDEQLSQKDEQLSQKESELDLMKAAFNEKVQELEALLKEHGIRY